MAGEYTGRQLIERFESLRNGRRTWEDHWQEIADHLIPRKATITTIRTPGTKAHTKRFASVPMHAHEVLAANLQGTLTSRSFRWFDLQIANDDELNKVPAIRQWLQESSKRMWNALNAANFHSAVHEFYIDLTGFGTAAMTCEPKQGPKKYNGLQFVTHPIEGYVFEEDDWGRANACCHIYSWTTRQIRKRFPDWVFPEKIERAYNNNPHERFPFLHWVLPRGDRDPEKVDTKNMEYASCWVDITSAEIIEESGYNEMPSMVTRWSRNSGEIYGRGPGNTALPDIKVLNKSTELELNAWAKFIDPPFFVLDDGVIGKVDLRPGKGTIIRDRDALWFYEFRGRADIGRIKFDELRNGIRQTFFADQLELPRSDRMTAEEIRTRVELMQRVLGPTLGRIETEFLNPLIDRVFGIMDRGGALPEPPEELIEAFGNKASIDVRYSGPLARSERMSEVFSVQRLYESLAQAAQIDPTVYDIINHEEAARFMASSQDIPEAILRSPDEMEEMRAQRAEAQQVQTQQQQGVEQAQIIESLARADKLTRE